MIDFVLGEVLEVVAFFPRKAREMGGFLLLALAVTAAMALESKPSPDLVITSADRSVVKVSTKIGTYESCETCLQKLNFELTQRAARAPNSSVSWSFCRSLDMSTQLVKQSVKMVVQNSGKQPTKVVHFLVDPAHQSQVIHIEAKVSVIDASKNIRVISN